MSAKKKTVKKVEKTEKVDVKPFDYKTWILVLFAVAALIVVIMAILKFTQNEKIDSSYFHDDDKKIVLTMDAENADLDDSKWEPEITHMVYYYDGNKITSARAFYEYETEAEAEEANKNLGLGEFADGKKVNGRFVVFDVNKSRYENLTVEKLRKNVELLKEINALILNYDKRSDEDEDE